VTIPPRVKLWRVAEGVLIVVGAIAVGYWLIYLPH
jgi:hypothetical protein